MPQGSANYHEHDGAPQGSEGREHDRVGQDVEVCDRHRYVGLTFLIPDGGGSVFQAIGGSSRSRRDGEPCCQEKADEGQGAPPMPVELGQPVREIGNDVSGGEERDRPEHRRDHGKWSTHRNLHVPAQHACRDVDQIARRPGRIVKKLEHLLAIPSSMLVGHEVHDPSGDLMQAGVPLPSRHGASLRAASSAPLFHDPS